MNLQNDPQSLAADEIRRRPAGACAPRTRPWCAARAATPTTSSSPGQAYAVMVRSRHAHGVINGDRHRRRARDAGRARRLYRRRSRRPTARSNASCRSRTATAREMKKPPRHALRDRQGALRRRSGRVRGRGDARRRRRTPPKRSRSTSSRCRRSPIRERGRAARTRRSSTTTCRTMSRSTITTATPSRSRPPSPRPRMSPTLKLVNSRVVVNAMEPRAAVGEYDPRAAASRCMRRRQGVFGMKRQHRATSSNVEPKQVRVLTGNVGGSFGMKARRLSRICLRAACGARARPSGEMDRRALRQLRLRQPRPRPRGHRRARARRRRHISSRCG